MDQEGIWEAQERKELLEHKAPQDLQDHKDLKDQLEIMELKELPVMQDQLVQWEKEDLTDTMDLRDQ